MRFSVTSDIKFINLRLNDFILGYNIVMKFKLIKIDFDSDTVKLLSERINILSWAIGGLNYIGFDIQGFTKIVTTVLGWLILQYVSFRFS